MECLICCDEITTYVISKCNHISMCLQCFLLQRIVYNQTDCPMCREKNELVYLSNTSTSYSEMISMDQSKFYHIPSYGIRTLDRKLYMYIKRLITPFCKTCRKTFGSVDELNAHQNEIHHKKMCPLCMKDEKVFVNEHVLYTETELLHHCNEMNPQTGKHVHPLCQFCHEMFMDEEKLNYHLNTCHERCYICCKHGHLDHYFKDYESLHLHFKKEHHVCHHVECKEKYMAFETEEELQYHIIANHTKKGQKFILPSISRQTSYHWRDDSSRTNQSSLSTDTLTEHQSQPKLQKKDFPRLKSTQSQPIVIIQQQSSAKKTSSSPQKRSKTNRGTKIFL